MTTERLWLTELTKSDAVFIKELVNTEGWLKNIGNRHIRNLDDALAYIERIVNAPNIIYWVVQIRDTDECIGVVTFIKRDYLDHHDIGFAFLPQYGGRGYALEATKAVLDLVKKDPNHKIVLATTMAGNTPSISLLQKLGFHFVKQLHHENAELSLYSDEY